MGPTLSFNTIISFMTNTNLQHYAGESGLFLFKSDDGYCLYDVCIGSQRLFGLYGVFVGDLRENRKMSVTSMKI